MEELNSVRVMYFSKEEIFLTIMPNKALITIRRIAIIIPVKYFPMPAFHLEIRPIWAYFRPRMAKKETTSTNTVIKKVASLVLNNVPKGVPRFSHKMSPGSGGYLTTTAFPLILSFSDL